MDKPEILERIRQTISELNDGSTMFAANVLHAIENTLANDIAAEAAARQAVVVSGEADLRMWFAAGRLHKKYLQVRAQRDAAREQVASVRTDNAALRCEVAELRLDLDEHKKWNVDYEVREVRLQSELDAAVEHRDRACGERNRFRDELAKVREYLANSESEAARDITAKAIADLNAVIDSRTAENATLKMANENLSFALGASRKHHAALVDKYNERMLELDQMRQLRHDLAEAKKQIRPPSDYSDLVTENARLRNTIREVTADRAAALKTLGDEWEQHLQLQAEHRWIQENFKKLQDERNAGPQASGDNIDRGVSWLVRQILEDDGLIPAKKKRIAVVVSDPRMIRDVVVTELVGRLSGQKISCEYSASQRTFRCRCTEIQFFVGNDRDRLRGYRWDAAWCDSPSRYTSPDIVATVRFSLNPNSNGLLLTETDPPESQPSIGLLAAQCAAHRAETNDELARHEALLRSLGNRLDKFRDI